jgi:hypothetical protein
MIDPELPDLVRNSAESLVNVMKAIDLQGLWQQLKQIEKGRLQEYLAYSKYPYGALPTGENLGITQYASEATLNVIGISSSEIYPDRWGCAPWAYIQAAGSQIATKIPIYMDSQFFELGHENFPENGNILDAVNDIYNITFRRMHMELKLAKRATTDHPNRLTLVRGPLLLPKSQGVSKSSINEHLNVLASMQGALIASVSAMCHTRYLINLVNLWRQLNQAKAVAPVITDAIFMNNVLRIKQRSAVFSYAGQQNELSKKFGVEILFFFMRTKNNDILRVEIPSWVADSSDHVNTIHATIQDQSQHDGFPAILEHLRRAVEIPAYIQNHYFDLEKDAYIKSGGYYYVPTKNRLLSSQKRKMKP